MGGLSFRVIDEREETAQLTKNPFSRRPASAPGRGLRIVFANFIDDLYILVSTRIDTGFHYGESAACFAHIFHQPAGIFQMVQDPIAVHYLECSE